MSSGGAALGEALAKVNRKWLFGAVVGIVLWLLVSQIFSPTVTIEAGMKAPDFVLEATDGKVFTLQNLRGVPVILNFWGARCPDCISELPAKVRFSRAHPEYEMLGVAVDSGGLETLAATRDELGIPYPVVESNAAVEASYGVEELPMTVLIDDQGIIQQVHQGKLSKQRMTGWTL